jgi:hypothetical protein
MDKKLSVLKAHLAGRKTLGTRVAKQPEVVVSIDESQQQSHEPPCQHSSQSLPNNNNKTRLKLRSKRTGKRSGRPGAFFHLK